MGIRIAELPSRFFEFAMIWALYYLAWRHPDLQKDWLLIGRKSKWVIAAVTGYFTITSVVQCFTFHQYDYPQKNEPFPFLRWAMFTGSRKSISEVDVYEFEGITASESEVFLNPAKLFFTPNAVVHYTRAQNLGDAILNGTPERKKQAVGQLQFYMDGLKKRYESGNPGENLKAIVLWRRSMPMKDGAIIPEPFRGPDSIAVFKQTYTER
jgi:hypothetical protein